MTARAVLIGVVFAALIGIATPASATTWAPPDSGLAPAYTVPTHYVDALVGTLRPDHVREYRQARRQALIDWGLPYTVTRLDESELAWVFDANIGTVGIDGMLVPDAILITRNHLNADNVGGYSDDVNAGVAVLYPWPGWWSGSGASSVIAHEVGHALGFYHGGTGVMGGNDHVNDEERALAAAYYDGGES